MTIATSPPDLADYLTGLPAPVQEQLVRIVRITLGMSPSEKELTRLSLALGGESLLAQSQTDEDDAVAAAELLTAVATIVAVAEDLANYAAGLL